MFRGDMTDSEWQRIQPLLPPEKTGKRGGQWRSHRQVIDGIRWIGRTGAPWRDLPERYGPWQTCAERLYRWQQDGTWDCHFSGYTGPDFSAKPVHPLSAKVVHSAPLRISPG